MLSGLVILALSHSLVQETVTPIEVLPSETDPAIKAFNFPHLVYLNPTAKKRNKLVIFLPGTNGKPGGTDAFCQTAADLGYDVLALAYPTDTPPPRFAEAPTRTRSRSFGVRSSRARTCRRISRSLGWIRSRIG